MTGNDGSLKTGIMDPYIVLESQSVPLHNVPGLNFLALPSNLGEVALCLTLEPNLGDGPKCIDWAKA